MHLPLPPDNHCTILWHVDCAVACHEAPFHTICISCQAGEKCAAEKEMTLQLAVLMQEMVVKMPVQEMVVKIGTVF